jgi:hypothetical protein
MTICGQLIVQFVGFHQTVMLLIGRPPFVLVDQHSFLNIVASLRFTIPFPVVSMTVCPPKYLSVYVLCFQYFSFHRGNQLSRQSFANICSYLSTLVCCRGSTCPVPCHWSCTGEVLKTIQYLLCEYRLQPCIRYQVYWTCVTAILSSSCLTHKLEHQYH